MDHGDSPASSLQSTGDTGHLLQELMNLQKSNGNKAYLYTVYSVIKCISLSEYIEVMIFPKSLCFIVHPEMVYSRISSDLHRY